MLLINSPEQLDHYKECLAIARQEYEDIVKNDVQKAISVDESAFKLYVLTILIM
jgi:serine protein kinase